MTAPTGPTPATGQTPPAEPTEPATAFHDLERYVALPRVSGLVLSPDGRRLVTSVSTLDAERTRYVTALWEVDPGAELPARRLTLSAKGEATPRFLPDGDLLFVSARPDPQVKPASDDVEPAVWCLPAEGGEPRVVATRPGGITGLAVARDDGRVVVLSPTMPAAVTAEDDERRRKERRERKINAILHESYPVRFWDRDLGPDQPRLLTGHVPAAPEAAAEPPVPDRAALHDLTPTPGGALVEAEFGLTPDGRTVVTTWAVPEPGGQRTSLAAIDTTTGAHRMLLDDSAHEYYRPVVSPDGRRVALVVSTRTTPQQPPLEQLAVLDLGLEQLRTVADGWDRWTTGCAWSPDGCALLVTADEDGRSPLFRIDLAAEGESAGRDVVTRLSTDHGCYSDVQVSADGQWVYALRSAIDAPPAPVRLSAWLPGEPQELPSPAPAPQLPGTLTEVHATAQDGAALRGWLVLPHGVCPQQPAALLLWVHGGPLHSWNSWSWRWNPWLMAAHGYAVLLPDPALSTGYGRAFIQRGWGAWGGAPYTDLMTITDAALSRGDLDAERTAAMGGSYGGYMANWIAGHTDRFRGIVTHASLWALDSFGPSTDASYYWRREMTAETALANSPHRFVDEIRTPMLVIHGDRDYRVPIAEGIRLWAELSERSGPGGLSPHKFLYFPDENHWVLSPQHARVWYETVFAFLATTVLDRPWQVPDLLR